MRSKLRARTPIIALAFICIAVLFIASCSTNEVEIPGLTGPSGARLFITIEASPDSVFIRKPSNAPGTSRITLQLKNQLGQGVPNARIKVRITNAEGAEVSIGTLDHLTVVTDSAGFARLTYTAPSTAEQPVPVQIFILAILTDPAYAFEVVSTLRLDLELARPFDCVAGPGAPAISFTFTPGAPAEDEQVCFDAQGTTDNGAIISFTWDFGDGRSDSGSFVCHTYTSQGLFPVTLTVIDGDQNCVSLTQLVDVGEGGSPTCTFTTSPNPVNTDTTVFFDASASTDSDGNIVSFSWNFGDGSTRSGEQVTHSFSTEGTFTVTLIVRDNAGNETVCSQTVTVATGIPSCDFTITPNPADVDEIVTFDASGSVDPDGGNLTFVWDFDASDGIDFTPGDASGVIVTETFSPAGVFIITLQVTDDEENVTTCTQTLTVGAGPTCSIDSVSDSSICTGDSVSFTASGSDPDTGAVTFDWDFGDGGSSSTQNPSHTFNTASPPGGTVVELTVTDDEGLICTDTAIINVEGDPTITSVGSGSAGDSITIGGTNFIGVTDVDFTDNSGNPIAATTFTVNSSTSISATVPDGAVDGPVTVTTTCGQVSGLFQLIEDVVCDQTPVVCEDEAATPLTFTIEVFSGSVPITVHQSITIGLSTTPGSAGEVVLACTGLVTDDFISLDGTSVTIASGAGSNTVDVTLCDDGDDPGITTCVGGTPENFFLNMVAPAGVTIADTTCEGRIGDSD